MEQPMRRGLILAAVVLVLGGGVVRRSLAGDVPPAAPPAPSALAPEAKLPRQRIDLGNGVSFEMVLIPAGEFDMGSPETEEGRRANEEARHHVVIPKPYALGTTETTQAVWVAVMGSNPSKSFVGEALPMTMVSWVEWQLFLEKLNQRVPGGGFRLPTEIEWEYACRAGSRSRYCFGDDEKDLPGYAWYFANGRRNPHPVGMLKSNAWGLHDMHGNVEEWCEDRGVRSMMAKEDGIRERVMRGGCHRSQAGDVRSSSRGMLSQEVKGADLTGCRLARTVAADAPPSQAPAAAPPPTPAPKAPSEPPSSTPPSPPAPKPPGEPTKPGVPTAKEDEIPSWAKVAPEQVEAAKKVGVPVAFENSIGMRFVLIPAGTFAMGSPPTEEGRWDDEALHEVTLSRPYYLGVTEVTNAQYRAFKPDHRSGIAYETLNGDDQPVSEISWHDAVAFADWTTKHDKRRTYRLPTEAEWERACRAGSRTRFWYGDDPELLTEYAWHGPREDLTASRPVALLKPSPWGLYDMFGNVWEWCADVYVPDLAGPARDPQGPSSGKLRTLRGLETSPLTSMSAAHRLGKVPDIHASIVGFRLAVTVLRK